MAAAKPSSPTRIADRYDVLEPLGRGGMATTYLVRDIVDGTRLALKLLHSDHPSMVEALRFEFRTLQALHHPHLCPVHDFGFLHPGDEIESVGHATCFYTAEAIDGVTLEAYASGRTWTSSLEPLVHALDALRLLHRVGVRHGDVKPSNVLVRQDGTGVLVDLGCARPLDMPPATQVSGTRAFLAPELLRGEASDARADLYAVGVTLDRLASVTSDGPPPEHRRLVTALRNRDPDARPKNLEEVLEALGARPAPIVPASTWRGRFVGRDTQLAAAQRAVDSLMARKPSPRVLCVTGEPGVGRSRLLQEIEWQTQPRCRVVRASQTAGLPVEDMLARALRGPVAPGPLGIVEALRELAARDEPVVLVLDDAQRLSVTHRERLAATARLVNSKGPVLLLLSSTPGCPFREAGVQDLHVEPLTATELDAWLAPTFGAGTIDAFARLTGGYPDAVNAVIALLRTGRQTEDDLARLEGGPALHEERARRLRAMPAPQRRAAGLMALLAGYLDEPAARALGIAPRTVEALRAAGLVERHGPGWKLIRPVEGAPLADQLPRRLRKRLHAELADWLRDRAQKEGDAVAASEQLAVVARHLALAGRERRAEALIREQADEHDRAPAVWLDAVESLLAGFAPDDGPVDLIVFASRLQRALGRAREARDRLVEAQARCASGSACGALRLELGACHAALGELQLAERELHASLGELSGRRDLGRAIVALARTQVRRGGYAEALDTIRGAERLGLASQDRAELLAVQGMAISYLGDAAQARRCLREAIDGLERAGRPRTQARAMASLALLELREGALEGAVRTLEAGLQVARRHGLAQHIGNLSLNLGVARHQQGAWTEAIEAYEKGLRVATALGSRATETTLLCNLAKAHADLGAFERAQQLAERGRELASSTLLPLSVAAADAVLAEVDQAQGRMPEAEARLMAARAAFAASDSAAELTEIELQLAEHAIAQGETERPRKWLDACSERLPDSEGPFLTGRLSLVRARAARQQGRKAEAIRSAERAVEAFAASQHRDAEAEARSLLAQLATETQAPHLARQHLSLARALWERCAASLPAAQRETFWLHPRRAGARDAESAAPALVPRTTVTLQRMLEVNKRLNSSLRSDDVLRAAMDAAVELTGAERGFVLLQQREKIGRPRLNVAVARNVDREQLGRSHLKFSRGIALSVLRTGQPVLSTDAASDDRFRGEESVHAMHLKSVACVPIHSPEGILGALYLDNRFQRGRFSDADVELLLAFADQVALAMRNARLLDELQARNAELEQERARVQALAEGQAAEIDRLHEQVRENRRSLERRYTYDRIVGTSEAMQRVFDVLDRVTDTSVPVLVQGDSGTGKELIARALHHNGPRSQGPLVTINCAALPEPLLESELFGHVRGAFTGADRDREGLVVRAAGGTLFLDEVAELSLATQAKLLRVLQEREVLPVGASKSTPVDFRLVCATNRDLRAQVARGEFREDLYYRIAVVEIRVPALRDRQEDIPALVRHILRDVASRTGRNAPEVSPAALRKLLRACWPGNVRQLENTLTRALILAPDEVIRAEDVDVPAPVVVPGEAQGRDAFERNERERILQVLEANRWNVRRAAPLLGLPRSTLYRKLKRYGIGVRARRGST